MKDTKEVKRMLNKINSDTPGIITSQYGKERDYWLDKLSGELGGRNFPYDHPYITNKRRMRTMAFEMPGKLVTRIMEVAGGSDIRLHMTLVASIVVLLYKYTNEEDILVGTPIYKQNIKGNFTNTVLVLRHQINHESTFKQLILQVRQVITEAMDNANYPIEKLLYHLKMSISENNFPLFDVAILLENIHDKKYLRNIPNNMTFSFRKTNNGLEGVLDYNSMLFEEETVARLINHFLNVIGEALFRVALPVSTINLLPEEEKQRILHHFNNNKVNFCQDKTVFQLFEKYAEKTPDQIAISFEGKELTYQKLNQRSNRLTRILRDYGIGQDRLVGILLNRSPLMAESILAVWKAAGAYIPIGLQYPRKRLLEVLSDSAAGILLIQGELDDNEIESGYKGRIIRVDKEIPGTREKPTNNPDLKIKINSLAYVIYTSGSTGAPKGVMIEHIGMMNHIYAKVRDLEITRKSIVAQNASHTFDISLWQFFAPLVLGGKTVIYPNEVVIRPDDFISQFRRDRITILEVVPSYLAIMLESLHSQSVTLEHLRYLLVTGETVKPILVKQWFDKYPDIKVVNAYGPTEASDDITHHIMKKPPDRDRIPIGKPVQNFNIYIVDSKMNLCPIGIRGEIYVSGVGVGRGYLNDPEKTRQVFTEDPFVDKKGIRLYKTGDFGCWLTDGTINFFGREDSQVKIRGFRIELGEIESQLVKHPQVKEAVVTANEEKGNEYLCAYVVTDDLLDTFELKEYLLELLPVYSVPTHFVKLGHLPLTLNGKIDRKVLPGPGAENSSEMLYITGESLKKMAVKPEKKSKHKGITEDYATNEYILSKEETAQLLHAFNDTSTEYPGFKTPQQLFAEQVEQTPDRVALVCEDRHLTYKTLNQKCNQLARLLKRKGVKANTLVGIILKRKLELIIGMLGILKAGGAYMPIDSENPEERKIYMLEFSQIQLLLAGDSETNRSPWGSVPEIVDLNKEENYRGDDSNLPRLSGPRDLAYVMFTSGTTGTPKGVMIENRSLVNLIKGVTDMVVFNDNDVILSLIQASFDMFGSETILPLTKGAKVIIGTEEEQKDIKAAASVLEKGCITIFQATPSYLQLILAENETAKSLRYLRYLLIAGEVFPRAARDKATRVTPAKIFDLYGPTEATIYATGKDVTGENPMNIGKPLANTRVYILNEAGKLLPVGFAGELCIGGEGAARGYFRRDHLTAEKFIKNPFVEGDRLYKTGDLARWLPDGNIELLGRKDHQVQIRGIRIEPEEIENWLLMHEHINEAVVVARDRDNGENELWAFVAFNKKLPVIKLREYLLKKLPLYMLPAHFVRLDKIPLTPNGKVNRRLLQSIDIKDNLRVKHDRPRTLEEEKLAEIWAEVLGQDSIGINENFFMIGGDSIKTIQVASRMKKAGYKVEMKDIFENPTIAQLAPLLKKLDQSDRTVDQSTVTGTVPLTPIQKAFFLSSPIEPHHFNMAVLLFSKERLDEEATRTVFGKIQEHHDALRMTFKESNGKIIQTNHGLEYPLELKVYDLKNVTQQKAVQLLEQEVNKIQASIDLEKGPLMKLGLFHLDDGDRLLIVIHHLVVDGVSWRILLEDADRLYHRYKNGEPLLLPLKTDSFKAWSEKLSMYANSESLLEEKTYWTVLESNVIPGIEKDFEEEINSRQDSQTLAFHLSLEDTALLLTKVNEAFATGINDILLTALGLAVRRSFGIKNVLIGLEGHGREEIFKDIDVQRTIGWFTSIHPVLLDISYKEDLARQIKEIKETLRHVPNKGIGYGVLKNLTAKKHTKDMEFNLKPQISFNYLGQFDEGLEQTAFGLAAESAGNNHAPAGRREYDLDILGMIMNKQLKLSLTYNKKQFKKETVETLCAHFKSDLIRIISFCSERETKELTPSDFSYKNISLKQLDSIFD